MEPNRFTNLASPKKGRLSQGASININNFKWFYSFFVLIQFEDKIRHTDEQRVLHKINDVFSLVLWPIKYTESEAKTNNDLACKTACTFPPFTCFLA